MFTHRMRQMKRTNSLFFPRKRNPLHTTQLLAKSGTRLTHFFSLLFFSSLTFSLSLVSFFILWLFSIHPSIHLPIHFLVLCVCLLNTLASWHGFHSLIFLLDFSHSLFSFLFFFTWRNATHLQQYNCLLCPLYFISPAALHFRCSFLIFLSLSLVRSNVTFR